MVVAAVPGFVPTTMIWRLSGDETMLLGVTDSLPMTLALLSSGAQLEVDPGAHTRSISAWWISHVPFSWLHQATLLCSTAIGVAFGWAGPLGAPEAGGDAIAICGAVAGPTSCEPTRKATTNVATTAPIAPNGVKPRPWRPRRSAGLATRLGRRAASLSRAADVRAHRSRGGA